jgi:hypothetical protein
VIAVLTIRIPRSIRNLSKGELAALLLATGLIGLWTGIALHDPVPYDAGLAYQAGSLAWHTGHPEQLTSWIGTPTLAALMAVVARTMSEATTVVLLTCLNGLLFLGMAIFAWHELRVRGSRVVAGLVLVAGSVFAPAVSSLFWKQLNIIVLTLAVASFVLTRRGRHRSAGLLLAISITVKPLVVLLPLALLLRRTTRRTGLWSIGFGVLLTVLGQALLAWRARSLSALNFMTAYWNFAAKAQPSNIWSCHAENFSPTSTLCRLIGGNYWTAQRVIIVLFVLTLALVAADLLRSLRSTSWYTFAFALVISPMISPIAWSHYQILLAPMFVLLTWAVTRRGGRLAEWVALTAAWLLAELVWRPYGTLPGLIEQAAGGRPQSIPGMFAVFSVAQFAQYVLFLGAVMVVSRVVAGVGDQAAPATQ